ncbi:MAG: M20/M25/M40 family metallo-hydrolase [Bacteroidales bacterium]|nr:M20/M25/M40 family metallo-hydrolase [Bacteroidales bacterium]
MKKISLLAATVIVLLVASCGQDKTVRPVTDPTIVKALASVNIDSVKTYIDELVALHTSHTLSAQTDPEKGIGAAVDYLAARCSSWAETASSDRPKPLVEKVFYTVGEKGGRYDRVTTVPELMVTLPGTDASREILLLAHIDTRVLDVMDSTAFAPGADDDGSGLACLLETVRILSGMPLEQTVKCLFVSGEEQGLDGSRHFAELASQDKWPVYAVLSNDMIGNSRASGTLLHEDHKVRVFSESRNGEDSHSRQLARYIKEMASVYVPDQKVVLNYRSDRYRRGGDQRYFQVEGFTAVRVCEYCEDYERTHQDVRSENGVDYGDMPEYVDFPYLVRNIKVNLAAVLNLAMAPDRPAKARIANANDLDNNTVLVWDPVLGPDGTPAKDVTYQVLCRETSQAEWLPVFPMGISDKVCGSPNEKGQMEFTCPLSKDNYYFAVRAVSAGGHPSLPMIAL